MRNRRRIQRTGPLIVYSKDDGIRKAFRNIPGVETMSVEKMNLLKLAPGGHVGRFVIWTESAFKRLDEIFGTWTNASTVKKSYNLPQPKMSNTDLTRLFKSDEIKKVLRKPNTKITLRKRRLNPLTNLRQLVKLNPYAAVVKRRVILANELRKHERNVEIAKRRGLTLKKSNRSVLAIKENTQRKNANKKRSIESKEKRAKSRPAKLAHFAENKKKSVAARAEKKKSLAAKLKAFKESKKAAAIAAAK